MIEIIGTIASVLAVMGVVLNNRRFRICFILWIVSNSLSMVIHAYTGVYSLAIRDVIFTILAIEGWYLGKIKV